MLFQSQGYILLFLPIFVASYYAVAHCERARHGVLISGSLIFYGWWDARFIPLLLGQILATWLLAFVHDRLHRQWPLWIGIAVNLLSLAIFKYADFLIGSLESATGIALPRGGLILPIGISFFSFQLISYLIDRMRDDAPMYPLRPFALFVLVFPHLIAGPIVRHNELIPQFFLNPLRDGLAQRCGAGLFIFTVGLAKKVLLADQLAVVVDPLFKASNERILTFGEAWSASVGFSFQLFLDFSAYTEMAIGSALMFGLLLPENFARPYIATDLRDFWRRWHISLSRFIRDYVYIPLGGSRHGTLRYVWATLGSMAICGLWHGAGWTYVVWGLWHGMGLVACRGWQAVSRPLPAIAGWALTMLFVLVGWVLFRSESFSAASGMLASLAGLHGVHGPIIGLKLCVMAGLVSVLVPSAHEIKDYFLRPYLPLAVASALLAAFCVLWGGTSAPVQFIYFQF